MTDQTPAGARLARLSDEFFEVVRTIDPLKAVSGFDALVPVPSRDVGEALASRDRGACGAVAPAPEAARRLDAR